MDKTLCTGEGVDMISEMPDSVLHHVLSFLSMQEAIRTSMLSRRWRYLWTRVSSICFQMKDYDLSNSSRKWFRELVRMVFLSREHLDLHKFKLDCLYDHGHRFFNTCMRYAIEHKVQEVDFSCSAMMEYLPKRIFNCQSLKMLKLQVVLPVFSLPGPVFLSQLKVLHLSTSPFPVCATSDYSLDRLIAGCPVLECLRIEFSDFQTISIMPPKPSMNTELRILHLYRVSFGILNISAPRLEKLYIENCHRDVDFFSGNDEAAIYLCTPNLRFLLYDVAFQRGFFTADLQSLVNASIWLQNASTTSECMHRILMALHNAHFLELSPEIMEYLLDEDNQLGATTTFHNLRKLEIKMWAKKRSFQAASSFLQLAPNLDNLWVSLAPMQPSGSEKAEDEDGCWKPIGTLLDLSHHIVTIKITGFTGSESDCAFVNWLIATAKALKSVKIIPYGHEIQEWWDAFRGQLYQLFPYYKGFSFSFCCTSGNSS